MSTIPHLPVIRLGRNYASLDKLDVKNHRTGETLDRDIATEQVHLMEHARPLREFERVEMAVLVQHPRRLQRLLEPDRSLDPVGHRQLGDDRGGVADPLFNGFGDLADEPGAVLYRTAVSVLALVDPRG